MSDDGRKERLMPGGIPRWIRIYDNGGETMDRYIVIYTGNFPGRGGQCFFRGMSKAPCSPQGYGIMESQREIIDRPAYGHLGKPISFEDLPEECQKLVISDYKAFWSLEDEAENKPEKQAKRQRRLRLPA